MQNRFEFEYAFIRYVPRVEREEFINVGVILFCKKKNFLSVRYHLDEERICSFSKDVDIHQLEQYLKSWDLISRADKSGGFIANLDISSRFRWMTAARSTILQPSNVHSGLCLDPDKMLNDLFRKFVL